MSVSKMCANPMCGRVFRRLAHSSAASWQARRYCCRACGQSSPSELDMSWVGAGVCREPWIDPELFFPLTIASSQGQAQVAEAKAVCEPCPVRAECLAWALEALPEFGIAGGLTPEERRELTLGVAS